MNGIPRDRYILQDRLEALQSEGHRMSQRCTASLRRHLDDEQKLITAVPHPGKEIFIKAKDPKSYTECNILS